MIRVKCPKCESEVEIEDKIVDGVQKTAVFCRKEDCFFYKNPLVGIDRAEPDEKDPTKKIHSVYISELLV